MTELMKKNGIELIADHYCFIRANVPDQEKYQEYILEWTKKGYELLHVVVTLIENGANFRHTWLMHYWLKRG